MDKIKVKVRPAETNVKIQYEGEELTIKELVDKADRDDWKELAEARYDWILELKKQLSDAQPVRHGRWKLGDCRWRGRADRGHHCPKNIYGEWIHRPPRVI